MDDIDGTVTTILAKMIGSADFEPCGSRIVATGAFIANATSQLAIISADGRSLSVLGGTEDGRTPMWSLSGIVYTTYRPDGPNELRIVSPSGGASRKLFSSAGVITPRLVSPP